jgi:hypothetical protein
MCRRVSPDPGLSHLGQTSESGPRRSDVELTSSNLTYSDLYEHMK